MEALTVSINQAVAQRDLAAILAIFRSGSHGASSSWTSVGPGEQRGLAAHLIVKVVQDMKVAATARPHCLDTAALENEDYRSVLISVLSHLPSTGVADAADTLLRERLFEYLVNEMDEPDYIGAARILGSIRMESTDTSSPYYLNAVRRTDVYVRMAECFLTADEIVEADSAVTRAGALVSAIAVDNNSNTEPGATMVVVDDAQQAAVALILRYKSTYARILDANRKFITAATRYHELSTSPHALALLDTDEILQFLGRAVTMAILAPGGNQKHRVIAQLVKDGPRLAQLAHLHSVPYQSAVAILYRMYHFQVILPTGPDVQTIEEHLLQEHHKAIRSDGYTVLQRCLI
jgi:COP9 signalosome complex subunit 4